jgi:hypothetical protein
MAFEPQLARAAFEERGAGQRHRAGAEATGAAGGAAVAGVALGRVSGPFWPQPVSVLATVAAMPTTIAHARRLATLRMIDRVPMRRIL